MNKKQYLSVSQFAKILGISRSAVHKKIQNGHIQAIRIGESWAIPRKYVDEIMGRAVSEKTEKMIKRAVKKTFDEYGEVLKLLGRE